MKKKKIFTLIMCLLPILLIVIGFSTWIIIHEFSVAPKFDPNSVFYTHLHNQEVTYNGQGQLPYNEKIDLDSGYIKYKYRKVGQLTNQYLEDGMPSNAGEYYIYFYDTRDENRYEPSDVKFTIKKADLVKKQDVSVNYNQGSNNGYFTTSMDVSTISYCGGEFVDPNDNSFIVSGNVIYSDESNLIVGTNSYQYTFQPNSIKDEWNEDVVNYNPYISECNIITKATVSFTNDGEQFANTLHVSYGETITVPTTSPTKYGYTFDGWYNDTAKWNFADSVTTDLNLVATYKAIEYNITYLDNDGSQLQTSNPTKYTIEDEITLSDPVKDGYAFLGWTGTGLSERTRTVKINKGSTGDREYISHWKVGIKIDALEIDYTSRKQWTAFKSDIVSAITSYLSTNYPTISLAYNTEYSINYMTDENYIEESTASGKIYNSNNIAKYVNGSTYIVNITLKNEEYALYDQVTKSYSETANILLKYKTVYVGSTLFTIEDAIANAGTSTIVTAGANTVVENGVTKSTFIRTNFSALDKAVTGYTDDNYNLKTKLRVPFANVDMDLHGSDGRTSNNDGFESVAVTAVSEVYSLLYIPENVNINIESGGSLVSAGLLGSSGGTKNRGAIYNNGTINANSNSNIYSYGYIKGSGLISLNTGSNLIDVCAIFDWLGGSKSGGLNNAKIFPINAFSIHNNSCKTKIHSGATYQAFWNIEFANRLYTGFQRGDKNGNIIIVGDNGLFKLSSGYIIKEADEGIKNSTAKNLSAFTGSNQVKGQRDIVRLFGTCIDNSITVKIDASLTSFNMTTSTTMALPIAYMKISTEVDNEGNTGNLTIQSSSYKFLPGTSLTIHKNTSLKVNSGVNMLFYDVSSCISDEAKRGSPFITSSGGHCIDRADAFVEVNGTLTINSGASIGGKITTNSENAQTIITGSATCGVLYTTSFSEGLITDSYGTSTKNYNAKMHFYNGNSIQDTLSSIAAGNYYSIKANEKYGWYSDKLKLYYDLNGGTSTAIPPSSEKDVGSNGYIIKNSDITTTIPTRSYYTFDDWYIDQSCSIKAVGTTIYSSVYLYAGWIPINYDITYSYIYNKCITSGSVINQNPSQYNNTSNFTLSTPIDGSLVFGGWYMDEDCTEELTQIYDMYGPLTIYGLWYPERTETYQVEYNIVNNSDKEGLLIEKEESTIVSINSSWKPDDLGIGINSNTSTSYYFDGWYTDSNYTNKFTSLTDNCTLYGKWVNKNVITLMYSGSEFGKYYYIPNSTINLSVGNSTASETMIWFTAENCATTNYYIGGQDYSSSSLPNEFTLYGEYYYIVNSTMYANESYSLSGKTNILFDGIDFNSKSSQMSVNVTLSYRIIGGWSSSVSKTNQNFLTSCKTTLNKIILTNCILVTVKSGLTYYVSSKKATFVGTKYGIAYNGVFDSCSSLSQVILNGSTSLTSQSFSNCSSSLKIINSNGIISDISKYVPADNKGPLDSSPTVIQ